MAKRPKKAAGKAQGKRGEAHVPKGPTPPVRAATAQGGPEIANLIDRLDVPRRIFVLAFILNGGNATRAYMEAYPRASYSTAKTEGPRILSKPEIQAALTQRIERAERQAIADADERDTVLTMVLRNPGYSVKERIRAITELNKCSGRHSMKHVHEGRLTLEQALQQSRA